MIEMFRGMYLTDLVYIEDGNPNEVASENKEQPTINFTKHYMIYRQIDAFQKFQINANFSSIEKEDPIYTFLFELPILLEEELYALSLDREPRE